MLQNTEPNLDVNPNSRFNQDFHFGILSARHYTPNRFRSSPFILKRFRWLRKGRVPPASG